MRKLNKHANGIKLVSKKWQVVLTDVRGHLHVSVRGPNKYRKQGLSSVKSDLFHFELKAATLFFYREVRLLQLSNDQVTFKPDWYNYADIFGSCFE